MSQRILIENAGVIKVNPEAGIGESVEVVFFRRQTKQETIEKKHTPQHSTVVVSTFNPFESYWYSIYQPMVGWWSMLVVELPIVGVVGNIRDSNIQKKTSKITGILNHHNQSTNHWIRICHIWSPSPKIYVKEKMKPKKKRKQSSKPAVDTPNTACLLKNPDVLTKLIEERLLY